MAVWFIILIYYIIFTSVIIMANMVIKKYCFSYLVLSNLSTIMCFLSIMYLQYSECSKAVYRIANTCAFMSFTVSIILGYVALKTFINLEIKRLQILLYAFLVIINTVISFTAPYYVTYMDKFILMVLFIKAAGNIFIKRKNDKISVLFAFIVLIFPVINIIIGVCSLIFHVKISNSITWGVYVLQSSTYSLFMLLYSIFEIKNESNRNVTLLNEAIKMDEFRMSAVSGITHELKTPINIISSSIQLLNDRYIGKDCYNEQKVKEYMDIMKKNSYRIIKIANNFIDINKAELDAFEIDYVMCDVVNLVESITMSTVPFAEAKGVEVIFDTNIEEYIMLCDIYKMERIILNLISNAIKFTNAENGMVWVNLNIDSDTANISVKDNGKGIALDRQHNIFQKFSQQASENNVIESSGLGLSLVKVFVDMLHGTVKLKSKEGEGAEFTVSLPIKICKECDVKEYKLDNERKLNVELSDLD
ncbi:sensor histidine kinase [Clostridium oryzae]|uniref:histidine kinase n=1 Tax=Clostridium oryzae TaxID=1450648 RepID=A0A1V4IPC9_9CLOT|nr:HAMP domain-containing sensor histidine kinase [Clostridium oryzae]OPJ61680.1 sensor histidine kinase TmoS [Clostridium oryzae]